MTSTEFIIEHLRPTLAISAALQPFWTYHISFRVRPLGLDLVETFGSGTGKESQGLECVGATELL